MNSRTTVIPTSRWRIVQILAASLVLAAAVICATGCTMARQGGEAAFDGARAAAARWWAEEGKDAASRIAKDAGEAAKDAAIKAAEEKREELRKKIEAGEGTTADKLLYALLAFAGGGGLGGIFMHKSSAKAPAPRA